MPSIQIVRSLAAVLALVAGTAQGFAQQPGRKPASDTIYVVRRDTIVLVRRDTVFFERPPAAAPAPVTTPPPSTADEEDQLDLERLERLERLRQLRAARDQGLYRDTLPDNERDADLLYEDRLIRLRELRAARDRALAAIPAIRGQDRAIAYYVYPTRLLEIDFPSVLAGINVVSKGRLGIVGQVGILTKPTLLDPSSSDIGEARLGIRGVEIGLEGRYYVSPLRKRFPFYTAASLHYANAPLTFSRFVRNQAGTFDRFTDVDATASRWTLGLMTGWEYRSADGFAIDFATGFHFGLRQLASDDLGFQREIRDTFFNVNGNGTPSPFLFPILRIGIGLGKW